MAVLSDVYLHAGHMHETDLHREKGILTQSVNACLLQALRCPRQLEGMDRASPMVALDTLCQLLHSPLLTHPAQHGLQLILMEGLQRLNGEHIIEALPASLHRWFASIGLLGEGSDAGPKKIPSWLLPHFAASVNALSNYTAESIDPDKCPNVTAIWCEDGVCKRPSDPRPDPFPYGHAQFLLDNRTDFGPNLWDVYLDKEKIATRHISNCNHFSMMKGKPVSYPRLKYSITNKTNTLPGQDAR